MNNVLGEPNSFVTKYIQFVSFFSTWLLWIDNYKNYSYLANKCAVLHRFKSLYLHLKLKVDTTDT
jgi:hypothetical protein